MGEPLPPLPSPLTQEELAEGQNTFLDHYQNQGHTYQMRQEYFDGWVVSYADCSPCGESFPVQMYER